MADTQNVKLGVCNIFYDGVDLGYTKGGVEVEVKTGTHKVQVDQFGESTVAEYINQRDVMAKVPLAETTLENMVNVMPGATLVQTGGTKASGTITVTQPTDGQTLIVNGVTVTFKTASADAKLDQVLIGATASDTATNLRAFLNASFRAEWAGATYAGTGTSVTITYDKKGTFGNSFALATGTSGMTVSGAVLTGGAEPTAARVDVKTGIGTNLLNISKELRLRPVENGNDPKDDFVILKAGTAGALSFAYKHDAERVYNAEFNGYPDPATQKLYYVGDVAAT